MAAGVRAGERYWRGGGGGADINSQGHAFTIHQKVCPPNLEMGIKFNQVVTQLEPPKDFKT